jgi:hypothetical protein
LFYRLIESNSTRFYNVIGIVVFSIEYLIILAIFEEADRTSACIKLLNHANLPENELEFKNVEMHNTGTIMHVYECINHKIFHHVTFFNIVIFVNAL